VYISTTGVYGDAGGAWVDEDCPPAPATSRARRRLDAEQTLARWAEPAGTQVIVLRVPGIYGPGRLPLERIRRGEPVLAPGECGYTNRIHAEDLVRVCVAAAQRGRPGAVYNVSDGAPGTMTEYLLAVADAAGLPRPPVVGLDQARRVMSPGMLSYLGESRRARRGAALSRSRERPGRLFHAHASRDRGRIGRAAYGVSKRPA
jgi:nucleoside-diphosphate-sugar epimerase